MDLRVQVLGRSYFSIDLVLVHLCGIPSGVLGRIPRRVAHLFYPVVTPAFPSLIVAQSGGGEGFLFRPS